jgi:hypothetical protein
MAVTCGGTLTDGPSIVWSALYQRFFYATWNAAQVCLTSAPAATPFNVDRSYVLPTSHWITNNPDQVHITASSNKIAMTLDDTATGTTHTLVIPMADVLAGVLQPHENVILHGGKVRPVVAIGGDDGAIFWTRLGAGPTVVIGRITGIPGQNGGITTSSTSYTVGPAADSSVRGVYVNGHVYLGIASRVARVVTLADINGVNTFAASLEATPGIGDSGPIIDSDVDATMATIAAVSREVSCFVSPGLAPGFGYADWPAISVSGTPNGRIVVGFVAANAVPWFAALTPTRLICQPVDTDVYSTVPGRIDFLPIGAAFPDPDAAHPGEWYAGVGWIDNTNRWHYVPGQHAAFLRDGDLQ